MAIRHGIAGRIHDQMLVAQAAGEGLVLIIRHPEIARYDVGSLTGGRHTVRGLDRHNAAAACL